MLAAVLLLTASIASAAAFTPGNIVVYRVGSGSALAGTATAVFVDEYTQAGVLVQSVALPTTTVGAQHALTSSGTSSAEGMMTRSNDGRYLILPGYDAALGAAVASAASNRVIGRVDSAGAIDTSTFETGSAGNIRGATSTNGTTLWYGASNNGYRSTTFGSSAASTQLNSTLTNARTINVFSGQLYCGASTGTNTFRGVSTIGTGTPTTTGQTITRLPGLTDAANPSTYNFFFADLSAGVAGLDTLYIADDSTNTIQKWSFAGGTWNLNGNITASGVRGLTGSVQNGSVLLFGTTGGTGSTGGGTIYKAIDTAGYNAAPSVATATNIATAATNTAIRGIAFVPQASPTVLSISRVGSSPTNASSVSFTVVFSQMVTGVDSADFALTTTGVSGASITGVTGSGDTYVVTVNTGSGDGTIRLDVNDNDSIVNDGGLALGGTGAGNGNFTTGQVYTVDKTAPTVLSANRAAASPTTSHTLSWTVTFSEAVSGFDAADVSFAVSGSLATSGAVSITGSGPYTVTQTFSGSEGTAQLLIGDDDSIVDGAGNPLGGTGAGNGAFNGQIYAVDNPPSVLSINRAGSSPTNAASVSFTVTFSESVTGVDASDFALATSGVTGASISGVTGSGPYTVTVNTGSGDGTVGLNFVDDDSVVDSVGNPVGGTGAGNGNFTGQVYTIDKTAPTVTSITRVNASPTAASSVDFLVTISESVTGVDAADFVLTTTGVTGTSITGVTGSGPYTVSVNTGSGSGTIRLDVAASPTVSDAAGNALAGGFNTGQVYTLDRNAPSVVSVIRTDPSTTNLASVHYTVTFSQSVTGVDATDFALTTTGVTGTSVSGVTGSGTTYTVTVNSGSGDGTLRLDVVDDDTIVSGTSVPLGGAGAGNGNFTVGEIYTIDKTAPTVISSVRVGTNPTNAASVSFTVTFSEPINGGANSDFVATMGGSVTGASVTGVVGSGISRTVTVNTGSGDGTIRLDVVTGGTITDAAGNALATGFTAGEVYTVDKTAPSVSSIVKASADPSSAATVDFTVTFSEAVSGVASGDFTITAPGISGTSVAGVTGGPAVYTVTVNTGTGNGSLRLDFTGSAADAAGNNTAGSFTTGESYTMQGTPATPAGLAATPGNNHVALTWGAAAGATTYNVKRGTVTGGPYTTLNSSVAVTNYDDLTAVNGTQYFYVVSANGLRGTSGNSNEVSATPSAPAANTLGLVISQVYGGGGNSGATYTNDFIEIFNKGNATVSLTGWSVQYASATGTSWQVTNLTGSIAPGHYYLIQEGAGAGGTTPLPSPDVATGAINMSATAGKVLLANVTTAQTGACPSNANIADFVGFGSTANCFEGTGPTPAPSNTNAVLRAQGGCTDTNQNASDFTAAAANPRNTASPTHDCSGFAVVASFNPTPVAQGGTTLLTATVTPGASPTSTGISVTANLTSIGGSASQTLFDNGTNGDVTPGDNIFSFSATVAPATTAGTKSIPVTATDAQLRSTGTNAALFVNPSALSTIAQAKVDTTPADTVPDLLGQVVKVRGVVTSIDFRNAIAGIEYYIQDATGGIDVFHSTNEVGPFALGTNLEVIGTVAQFNGLTEITPSTITTLPGGTLPPVSPQVITLAQLANGGGSGEPLEGQLVTINGVSITSGTYPASGSSGNVTIGDGVNSGTMRINSATDIDGSPTTGGTFSVTGLVTQSDTTNPFDTGYQILPRALTDINTQTPPVGSGNANPSSVAPGGTTLLTVTVTPGTNPSSTGIAVVADLSAIGGSATQTFFDNGTNGDANAGDNVFSFSATVAPATPLGGKTLPFSVTDAQARGSSGSISLTVQSASAPPPPTGLAATAGNLQVALTWNASPGATGYNVKRSTSNGGPYATIAPNVAPTNYTDTTVANGTTYYYVVTALNGADESGPSNQVSALPSAPPPAGALGKVYFIDIGQGASTLIVSPTGKTLLVDGGPTGQGNAKIVPLLSTLGIATIDYTVLTHYHIDHDDGLLEVINAGKVAGTAYDNGDTAPLIPPNFSTSPSSTYGTYARYISAINSHPSVIRVRPEDVGGSLAGTVIDLGGGMKATILAQGGKLLSGGSVTISNQDLNTESISVLVEYNNFDFLVSGDLTGGGSTSTAKTPDVETFVGQMAGDVDVMEYDHHGSTTANNRRFFKALKAEAAVAEIGYTNTFGHPNRETVNKYLNIPVTSGNAFGGTSTAVPGNGPVSYQTDPSPSSDARCSVQGFSGAAPANAGNGTILLKTDGTTSFTMESFEDGGVRISPSAHVYALDATGAGVTTNFPPTVIPSIAPAVPLASDTVTVTAQVFDREDPVTSVTLNYALNGVAQAPVTMTPAGGGNFTVTIAPQPDATRVDYTVTGVAGGKSTSFSGGYFSGTTPISTLRALDALGEPLYYDYAARVQGVVTAGTGLYASSNNDDYIQDATGGINIWRTTQPSTPAVQTTSTGSIYSCYGLIGNGAGRLRIEVTPPFESPTTPYGCTLISASSVPAPLVRTIAQINANPEAIEAQLVQINNATISGSIPASPASADAFLSITDGTGTFQLKIDADSDVPGMTTPSGPTTIVGIIQQDDFLRPFSTAYNIAPRNRADLGGVSGGGPGLISIADARIDVDAGGNSPGDYVPDRLNSTVHVQGVVTSINFRQSNGSGIEYYIQDPTAGVDVFSTATTRTLNIGDNVDVTATVKQFNGLTEIDPGATLSNLTVLAPGTLPAVPTQVVTCSQLGDNGAGEPLEGRLLRINNVTLASPPATWAGGTNYVINDSTGPCTLRISASTNLVGQAPPAGTFSVVGVLGQFDSTGPFDSGYQLFPRSTSDMLPAVATPASIAATAGTPQSATVGTAFATQLAATVKDSGNVAIAGAGVTFTAPASGASGTFPGGVTSVSVTTDGSGVATAPVFTANALAGPYNVVASTTNALTANFSLTNIAPAATHFSVTAPANVTSGTPFSVTVTALNGANATVTNYTGTVHFTSSSSGTLPGDYTFTGGDNGTHTFTNGFTLTTGGAQTITATDTFDGAITGSANTTVNCPSLSVTATNNGPICQGGTLQLDVTNVPGATYSWSGPNGFTAAVRNPSIGGATAAATGTYSVTITNSGCIYNASTNATVNAAVTPTINPGGPTTFCAGGSVLLTSSSASGNQWKLNGSPIGGATNQAFSASASGSYTVTVTDGNGCSATSAPTSVTVNPLPPTPTITPGGPTTFCQGGSVTLTSSAASGNQWKLNGSPIGGATGTTYPATASGSYTVTVTDGNGCSATSAPTSVTVNPTPATPTITPNGPVTFCAGGSVTLQSSSASGNQWSLNGSPIGGQTAQTLVVNSSGDYTVVVTQSGCASAASAVTTVSVNPNPNATITAPGSVQTGTTGNVASVANAGAGASYNWSITNGTITGGTGTNSITFTAGAVGTLTLNVTVTDANGCTDAKSANVNVTANTPGLSITSVVPPAGLTTGGKSVTINGTGFVNGATVTFGGAAATNVVVVNSTKITATTPAHAGGAVNVTVTNPSSASATLTNGYTYVPKQFDANGDHVIDPSDIFYLVNYLFLNGPAPAGQTGADAGDANGDGTVDSADIFYLINYLYLHGPAPASQPPGPSAQSLRQPLTGSVTLGEPVRRGNKFFVPVIVDSANAEGLSLRVVFSGDPVRKAAIHSVAGTRPVFEISRSAPGSLAYLLAGGGRLSGVVAEIEVDAAGQVAIGVDPALTLLSDAGGTRKATVAGGTLRVSGTTIEDNARPERKE
ncbi:MAG TPA: lamin tail domain-containing protein [Thermoanaerobaculia bacterium]|nr:lamin tail domain-containing protein [Thermoanaerobaculia bacterium]